MAWSVLQSRSATVSSGNGAVTFATANLSSGTKITCAVVVSNSSGGVEPVSGVSDGTNAFTKRSSVVLTGNVFVELWDLDTPAGKVGTKPTITATVSSNFGVSMLVQEVSGLAAGTTNAAVLDGTPGQNAGTASPATTGATSSSASSEYTVALYGDPGDGISVSTPTSGYTPDASNVNASGFATLFLAYKNSANGPESASFTLSGAAVDGWETILLTYKLAGGSLVTMTFPVTAGTTGALARQVRRPLASPVTSSGALQRTAGRSLPVTVAASASLSRSLSRALAVPVTASASLARTVARTLAAAVTTQGSAARRPGKSLTASVTTSGALARSALKTLPAVVTTAGSASRALSRTLAVTAATAGAVARSLARTVSAGVTISGSLTRVPGKVLAASVTASASMNLIRGKLLAVTVTTSGTLGRALSRTFAATVTGSGTLLRRIARTFGAGVTTAGSGSFVPPHPSRTLFLTPGRARFRWLPGAAFARWVTGKPFTREDPGPPRAG